MFEQPGCECAMHIATYHSDHVDSYLLSNVSMSCCVQNISCCVQSMSCCVLTAECELQCGSVAVHFIG